MKLHYRNKQKESEESAARMEKKGLLPSMSSREYKSGSLCLSLCQPVCYSALSWLVCRAKTVAINLDVNLDDLPVKGQCCQFEKKGSFWYFA